MLKRNLKIFIATNFPHFARWLRRLDGYAIDAHQMLFSAFSRIASGFGVNSNLFAAAKGIIKAKSISGERLKSGISEISYIPISRSIGYERNGTPKTIHQKIYSGFETSNSYASENVGIIEATNLRLYGKQGWAFLTDRLEIIEEISFFVWGIAKSEVFRVQKIPKSEYIGRRVAAILEPKANNYTHWLLETVPRLKILVDKIVSRNEVDKIIINHTGLPYQLETFRALKMPSEKIVQWQPGLAYFADQWFIPTPTSRGGLNVTIDSVNTLRNIFLGNYIKEAGPEKFPSRIYLSRKDADYRFVINEDEIVEILKEYGFEFLTLAGRSIYEQADIFKNAEVVIGLESAGFGNVIFCCTGTKIINIMPDMYFCRIHRNMCGLCNLDYYYFFASGRQPEFPPTELNASYANSVINPASLRSILELAGISKQ